MENKEQKINNKKAKRKIVYFLSGLILCGALYGSYWKIFLSSYEETENSYVNGNQNLITSSISGNIVGLYINDGLSVNKGLIAIKIEDTDYKINLEKAANDLAKATRNYKILQFNKKQSQESYKLKKKDLDKAQDDYTRDSKALIAELISKEQFENTKYKLNQAELILENAKLGVENSELQAFAISIKEHPDVQKAINQYRQAYIDLSRTIIKVPESGIIAKKSVNIGQKITINQALFNVIDEKNEWVDANFKESQLKNIKVGQKVELESDVNDKTYNGYVTSIGGGSGSALSLLPAQNATGNWIKVVQRVPVRIDLEKAELNGYLPIGTSMRAKINTKEIVKIISNYKQEIILDYNEDQINKEINKIIENNIKN